MSSLLPLAFALLLLLLELASLLFLLESLIWIAFLTAAPFYFLFQAYRYLLLLANLLLQASLL
jgi:hypothetical protein